MNIALSPGIFRAYDIRGVYGQDIDEGVARILGRAFAEYIGAGNLVVIGRDVRLSSPSLEEAFTEGLQRGGCNVVRMGLQPTPFVYYGTIHHQAKGGVVVSASHNPPDWNGFKLCREGGLLIAEGMGMERVKELAFKGSLEERPPGTVRSDDEVADEFVKLMLSKVRIGGGIKVAVDPGNGSCSRVASRILREAGVDVLAINDDPDGGFPNRSPEPNQENLKPLAKLVVDKGFDFGLAFDGDGDRAIFIDDRGKILSGDVVLAIFAKTYLSQRKGKVLMDVACSMALESVVSGLGGELVVSRVGHSYMLHKMVEEKCLVGGEISSHIYFSEIYGLDDAIFAGLKMAEVISKNGSLSSQVELIPQYPATPVITYPCPDEKKFEVVNRLRRIYELQGYRILTVDGVKIVTDRGWALVRASNTLPQVKARFEALTEEDLTNLRRDVETKLFSLL